MVSRNTAPNLAPRAPQRGVQSFLLLDPTSILGSRSLLKSLDLGLNGRDPLHMLPLGFCQRCLRLGHGLLPKFTPPLLPFVGDRRLPSAALSMGGGEAFLGSRPCDLRAAFAGLSVSPRLVGSSACSLKDPSDPIGRLRTTPGFAMVAAITFGSSLSFAAPWWKRLLSALRRGFELTNLATVARTRTPTRPFNSPRYLLLRSGCCYGSYVAGDLHDASPDES
jgi:hypothetical protein